MDRKACQSVAKTSSILLSTVFCYKDSDYLICLLVQTALRSDNLLILSELLSAFCIIKLVEMSQKQVQYCFLPQTFDYLARFTARIAPRFDSLLILHELLSAVYIIRLDEMSQSEFNFSLNCFPLQSARLFGTLFRANRTPIRQFDNFVWII